MAQEQETKRKIQDPAGNTVDGTLVGITESTERFSEVQLEDGTRLRVRMVVQEVIRFDNLWDPNGNPVYSVNTATLPTVTSSPAVLKKPASERKDN